jgi:hypothetical protein
MIVSAALQKRCICNKTSGIRGASTRRAGWAYYYYEGIYHAI